MSAIRQHTVRDNNRKEGISINFKVIGPKKKNIKNIEIHRQIKKQVSTARPELYNTHPELQHTKIKTHHYIETAILRLYKL